MLEGNGTPTIDSNTFGTLITWFGNTVLLEGISIDQVGGADFISNSSEDMNLTGTSGDDVLVGGLGNDVLNGGDGSDEMYGWNGDDVFNITGKTNNWIDVVNGGSGSDTLNINISKDLEFFNISYDYAQEIFSFKSASLTEFEGEIYFESIENLYVDEIFWDILLGDGSTRSHTSDMCAGYSRYDGVLASPVSGRIRLFDWDTSNESNIAIYVWILLH